METLVNAHPEPMDAILGNELSWELGRNPRENGHSMLLQSISYAPNPVARIFLPRLGTWLNADGDVVDDASDLAGAVKRLRQVIGAILKHGDEDVRAHLLAVARRRLQGRLPDKLVFVWLPTLMRIDPQLGVAAFEDRIRTVEPGRVAKQSRGSVFFLVIAMIQLI